MKKKDAIRVILSDIAKYDTSLNYAVNYCIKAMKMPEDSEAFDTQALYILNNITYWRHPLAKKVRKVLKS